MTLPRHALYEESYGESASYLREEPDPPEVCPGCENEIDPREATGKCGLCGGATCGMCEGFHEGRECVEGER